jgi:hypothetical protein
VPDAKRIAHLTTVDMSLALLLATELAVDVEAGFEVFGLSAPGPYVAQVEALGVTHVPLPSLTRAWDPRRDLAGARELARTLRALCGFPPLFRPSFSSTSRRPPPLRPR